MNAFRLVAGDRGSSLGGFVIRVRMNGEDAEPLGHPLTILSSAALPGRAGPPKAQTVGHQADGNP